MNKLSFQIRCAKADLYSSIPASLRAFHAIARIAGRQKKAYSAGMITQLVNSELAKAKVQAPDIDWGRIFVTAVRKTVRKFNLGRQEAEDFLADVVADTVMGESITTIRDSGPWKRNLVEQIEDWSKKGWDENRIKATLAKWLNDKMYNIWHRWNAMNQGGNDISFESGAPGDDYEGGAVFEDLFTMDGLSSGQMGAYHSLLRQNPEVRLLVQKIEKTISQRDDDMALIWQAYTNDPDASMRDLLQVPVKVQGARMPLEEALGFEPGAASNKQNLYNRVKKLRDLLRRLWPSIDGTLRDIMYS